MTFKTTDVQHNTTHHNPPEGSDPLFAKKIGSPFALSPSAGLKILDPLEPTDTSVDILTSELAALKTNKPYLFNQTPPAEEKDSSTLAYLHQKLLKQAEEKLAPLTGEQLAFIQTNPDTHAKYKDLLNKMVAFKSFLKQNTSNLTLKKYREKLENFDYLKQEYKRFKKQHQQPSQSSVQTQPIAPVSEASPIKTERKQGFWSKFLPSYIGNHFIVIGTLVTVALGIMAVGGGALGGGMVPSLLGFLMASSGAYYYFALDGQAFKRMLRKTGEKLDNFNAAEFLNKNIWALLKYATIAALTLTAILLVSFPPAAFASFLAATGLTSLTLTLTLGLGTLFGSQLFFWAASWIIKGAKSLYQSLFCEQDAPVVVKNKKTPGFWESILVELLGVPMATMSSLIEGALFGTAIVLFLGTGGMVNFIAGVVAVIMGSIYYSMEVAAGQKFLRESGQALDNLSWNNIKENSDKLMTFGIITACVLTIATIITAMVVFPPVSVALGITSTISTLGLGGLTTLKLGGLTFVVSAMLSSFALWLVNDVSEYLKEKFANQSAQDEVTESVSKKNNVNAKENTHQKVCVPSLKTDSYSLVNTQTAPLEDEKKSPRQVAEKAPISPRRIVREGLIVAATTEEEQPSTAKLARRSMEKVWKTPNPTQPCVTSRRVVSSRPH